LVKFRFEEKKMLSIAKTKFAAITPPAAIVDNAAFTTTAIDTKGFAWLTIVVLFGALDIAPASSKIRQSDASNMSSSSDIAVGGTDYSLATASSDNQFHVFDINLLGKKRYIDFEITGGDGTTGTYMTAIAILSRGAEAPDSVTERNVEVYGLF
jgi:hypothetical protein